MEEGCARRKYKLNCSVTILSAKVSAFIAITHSVKIIWNQLFNILTIVASTKLPVLLYINNWGILNL